MNMSLKNFSEFHIELNDKNFKNLENLNMSKRISTTKPNSFIFRRFSQNSHISSFIFIDGETVLCEYKTQSNMRFEIIDKLVFDHKRCTHNMNISFLILLFRYFKYDVIYSKRRILNVKDLSVENYKKHRIDLKFKEDETIVFVPDAHFFIDYLKITKRLPAENRID